MDEIGGYWLRRRIAEMPSSELYEAERKSSGGRVIVELLRDDLCRAEAARGSLGDLEERLHAFEHPNLARCIERLEADGKLGLAFEAPAGPSLRTALVDAGRLPWEVASSVVARVARGLGEAHGRVPSLLHLDLRPERVLLGRDGTVRLYGLGLAALADVLGKGAPRGLDMLRYMSPEQIDGTNVDARADLYGLGLLLYELLAGHSPFQSSSIRTLVSMQCSEAPVPLADHVRGSLPQGVTALLFQLLEKEPGKRPQTSRELFERLEAFLPGDASAALGRWIDAADARTGKGAELARREERRQDSEQVAEPRPQAPRSEDAAREEASRATPGPTDAKEPAAAAGATPVAKAKSAERELSVRQALLLVIGLTVLAALAAYISRAACSGVPGEPSTTEYLAPPSKPLGTVSPHE